MPQELDPDRFEERWREHTADLYRLWNTLPEEHWDDLESVIEDANELVEIAADELREDE